MKRQHLAMILILSAVILAAVVQQASAQSLSANSPILLGTTGACNSVNQGGPCTTKSRLMRIDPLTGALIRDIGPVGFTVNGLAWDSLSGKLYASTASGDTTFHGLITIDPFTGKGTPVDKLVVNFGLPFAAGSPESPIHSIAIDPFGHMVGWYDEFPPPNGVTDTFVRIDQLTGIATEFNDTGIDTRQNGLSFGEFNRLWNIDSPRVANNGTTTQTAYNIDPSNGKMLSSTLLAPPAAAALGDFRPGTNLYYGLNFDTVGLPGTPSSIVVVDPSAGTVTPLGPTVVDLHTLAFVKGPWAPTSLNLPLVFNTFSR